MPSGPEHAVPIREQRTRRRRDDHHQPPGEPGSLPAALSGQYMRIGPNRIDAQISPRGLGGRRGDGPRGQPRRRTSHLVPEPLDHDRRRRPEARRRADARPATVGDDVVAANLIAFGTSILAFGDGALAYELSARLDTIRRVDLAGARRSLVAHSKVDPHTGELHLLTFASTGSQLHVAVSRGALTRTIRSIDDAPSRIRQLELTRDDVVLVADGFVGVTARAGINTQPIWFEIDTEARHIAAAYAHGETVIVYATGPSLVRWTLDRRAATAHCEVLDPTLHTSATSNRRQPGSAQRFLWTVGAGTAHKHDLFTGGHRSARLRRRPHPGRARLHR